MDPSSRDCTKHATDFNKTATNFTKSTTDKKQLRAFLSVGAGLVERGEGRRFRLLLRSGSTDVVSGANAAELCFNGRMSGAGAAFLALLQLGLASAFAV